MNNLVVAYQPWGDCSNLFPFWPRGKLDDALWAFPDLVVLLGNLPNDYVVRRVNNKDPVVFKYLLVASDGEADFRVSIGKNLQFANLEVLRESGLPPRKAIFIERRHVWIYQWIQYWPQLTGDMYRRSVLTGLFNSLRQIARKNQLCEVYIYSLFGRAQKTTRIEKGVRIASQFRQFLENLKGYVMVKADRNISGENGELACRSPIKIEHNGGQVRLVSMVWLAPGTLDVIEKFNYCELDATFYTMKPYVMCVPQFIKKNAAYPVGLIIGPSESRELYEMFYEAVCHMAQLTGINPGFRFPVLSDAGWALKKFCKRHGLQQYQCHRHLIEWFGNNSILRMMFIKLLRSQNIEELRENLRISNLVFTTLNSENKITESVRTKYLKFTGQVIDANGQLTDHRNQLNKWMKWCLFLRGNVTSCSNHAECFHHVLKAAVKPNGKHIGIGKCLLTSYNVIGKKQRGWKKGFARNLSSYIRSGDHPPDWRYVREVARRFELTIPPELEHLPTERQVFEALLEIGTADLQGIEITEIPIHQVFLTAWTGPEAFVAGSRNQDLPPSPEIAEVGDPVTQLARDIYAVVGDSIHRPEPFAWVFHWCMEAIRLHHLDPIAAPAQAYITAWDHVRQQLGRA